MTAQAQKTRNRKDHYLPQGYLRGFIDPSRQYRFKPLWYFDVATGEWKERSTRQVGYGEGFYDHAGEETHLEPADITFARLERDFPLVRDRLIANNFRNWEDDLHFLLSFMQMMRARSPLFFAQVEAEGTKLEAYTITEVLSDTQLRFDPNPKPLPEAAIRNRILVNMREEIRKEAGQLTEFHWALRYTDTPADPVITSEQPMLLEGSFATIEQGWASPDSWIYFPLCWRACLFGSRVTPTPETDRFDPRDLRRIRSIYKEAAGEFLVSPQPISQW